MSEPLTLAVGDPAPDFDLPDAAGQRVSLASLRGRWVVVYLYPKDNTSGCTTEALEFTALAPEFQALGCEVLGVSKDSAASHASFTAKHNLGIPLLADVDRTLIEAYGGWREKNMCGKVGMGVVRSTVLIDPQGRVAQYWPKVAKAAGHAQKVLDELKKRV